MGPGSPEWKKGDGIGRLGGTGTERDKKNSRGLRIAGE